MVRVKICGINSIEALAAATQAGADWVGFVFFPPSPRAVTPEQAAMLSASVPGTPLRVGLFVDPADDAVAATLAHMALDMLQIHAPPERAAALRTRFGLPVWRAVGVSTSGSLPSAAPGIDALLLDAAAPPGAELPGGNARTFHWPMLRDWVAPTSWLLAGGLTPSNVATAIAQSGATAVDVSSGVESTRGVKDATLIAAFIAAARGPARRAPSTTHPRSATA